MKERDADSTHNRQYKVTGRVLIYPCQVCGEPTDNSYLRDFGDDFYWCSLCDKHISFKKTQPSK